MSFGELYLVCRFLKAVFNLRPTLPTYSTIWNVSVVTKNLQALNEYDLKSFSYRLAILLCIPTGQLGKTLF